MSTNVLLNLSNINELGEKDKMRDLSEHLISFLQQI